MSFARQYLDEVQQVTAQLDADAIERVAEELACVRERGGRLFILGVGGSAGNASHAVNDFRKICGFEAYAPTDNVSELTARTNDEGWATVFAEWPSSSICTGSSEKLRSSAAVWVSIDPQKATFSGVMKIAPSVDNVLIDTDSAALPPARWVKKFEM